MASKKQHNKNVDSDVQQLQSLIPGLTGNASQAEVMQEAAKYIDKLQNNLICHIRTHGYPDKLKSVAGRNAMNHDREGIRRTVESYIVSNNKKWMK